VNRHLPDETVQLRRVSLALPADMIATLLGFDVSGPRSAMLIPGFLISPAAL